MTCLFAVRTDAKAKALEIDVYDVIGEGLFFRGVLAKDVLDALQSSKDATSIRVRVNSIGGDVDEANAMHALLRERSAAGAKVHVSVDGLAASAATIVADAGDEVTIAPNAFFMIHDASRGTGGRGTVSDHQKSIDRLQLANDALAKMYASASERRGKGKTADEFLAEMTKERYLNATEAVEWGLADRVADEARVAACADVTTLANAPRELREAYDRVIATRVVAQEPATAPSAPVVVQPTSPVRGEDDTMKFSKETMALLGLSEDADLAAVEAAIRTKASVPVSASAEVMRALGARSDTEGQARAAELSRLGVTLLALTSKSTHAEAIVEIGAWREQSAQATKLAATVTDLHKQIGDAKRDGLIAKLSAEGKLPPAAHDWAKTQTADQLETFAIAFPKFASAGANEPHLVPTVLTDDEKKVCASLGIPEDKYLAEKKNKHDRLLGGQGGV